MLNSIRAPGRRSDGLPTSLSCRKTSGDPSSTLTKPNGFPLFQPLNVPSIHDSVQNSGDASETSVLEMRSIGLPRGDRKSRLAPSLGNWMEPTSRDLPFLPSLPLRLV